MKNPQKKNFTVNVQIRAIVEMSVTANSIEESLEIAKTHLGETQFFADGFNVIDANEKIVGVSDDWEID